MNNSKSQLKKLKAQQEELRKQIVAKEIAEEFVRISKISDAGNKHEAWRAATVLHNKYPGEATPNFMLALMLNKDKENGKALAYAKEAVRLAPNNAIQKVFLGKLYVNTGLIEFATEILHSAYALDKTQYQAPLILGYYYAEAGQSDKALPYFERALKTSPPMVRYGILLAQATCLASLGRSDEAEAIFIELMDVPQLKSPALAQAAQLGKNDQHSGYAARIVKELEIPDLNILARSSLLLCLGRLHENGRDFDGAFENFEKSKSALRSQYQPSNFRNIIDDAVYVLTREVFEKYRSFGNPSDRPIFVVGMPRTGTTMTEQIIASHSQAEGVGELQRMMQMYEHISHPGGARQILRTMAEFGPEKWQDIPRQYLRLLDTLAPGARRTVDKMPHNFLYIGLIHLCFPSAKIINCRRNPLDSFISAFQNEMTRSHSYSYSQEAYAEHYIDYLHVMEHWKQSLPGSVFDLHYENITENPAEEVGNMLNFLGLPWEDACLKFHERGATVKTLSRAQVRDPINRRSVARWRNYEKHLGPIMMAFEKAGVEF
jgi:tetratricopeptide (TPR) repeat protein